MSCDWLCVRVRASVCVCVCHAGPHALSALSSLQGNRCQQSCLAGFYHDEQKAACKPCHEACATCAGEGRGQRSKVRVGCGETGAVGVDCLKTRRRFSMISLLVYIYIYVFAKKCIHTVYLYTLNNARINLKEHYDILTP